MHALLGHVEKSGLIMTQYAVISMVKPTYEILNKFINHHLNQGASQIILMHDGSADQLFEAGINLDKLRSRNVFLIVMDDEFWLENNGFIPKEFTKRRAFATSFARKQCFTEWFLFIDEDEFLIDRINLLEVINHIPNDVDAVLIRVAEAIWGPGDSLGEAFKSTWFRRPFPSWKSWKKNRRRIHGIFWPFFLKGMTGYIYGKQLIRNSATFDAVNAHSCVRYGVNVTVPIGNIKRSFDELEIAHFDAISFSRWETKMKARVTDRSFKDISRNHRIRQSRIAGTILNRYNFTKKILFRKLYSVDQKSMKACKEKDIFFQYSVDFS